ncbi:MAG: serine hydrolase [Planctomycetota bacterium]
MLRSLCLIATLIPSPGAPPVPHAPSVPHPASRAQKTSPKKAIADYLEGCEALGLSGSVHVQVGKKVLFSGGLGLADRKKKRKNADDTLFEIASATKPFTACAILALAEDGKLALDDPISEHLPGVPEDRSGITVRHLLSHMSGMPRSAAAGYGPDLEVAVKAYLAPDPARPPGREYEYWNGGFALLAGIVAEVSGQTYQDYCRTRLFERVGLEATGFTGDTDLPKKRLATGYDEEGNALRLATGHPYRDYGYQYIGMGGIVTCAGDLVQFMEALEDGEILTKDSVDAMLAGETEFYGLGWSLRRTRAGDRQYGHGGDVAGFHTQWARIPAKDLHVVALANVDGIPMHSISGNLTALALGERPPFPLPPPTAKVSKGELKAAAGTYADEAGNRIVVAVEGSSLVVTAEEYDPSQLAGDAIPERLAEHARAAEQILDLIQAGDTDAIALRLSERVRVAWASQLIGSIWPSHVEKYGELKSATAVRVLDKGNGVFSTMLRLEHESATRPLEIGLVQGKLQLFDLSAPLEPLAGRYTKTDEHKFSCFDWGTPVNKTLTFDGDRRRAKSVAAFAMGIQPTRLQRVD